MWGTTEPKRSFEEALAWYLLYRMRQTPRKGRKADGGRSIHSSRSNMAARPMWNGLARFLTALTVASSLL